MLFYLREANKKLLESKNSELARILRQTWKSCSEPALPNFLNLLFFISLKRKMKQSSNFVDGTKEHGFGKTNFFLQIL
jgi:hypothetical protein